MMLLPLQQHLDHLVRTDGGLATGGRSTVDQRHVAVVLSIVGPQRVRARDKKELGSAGIVATAANRHTFGSKTTITHHLPVAKERTTWSSGNGRRQSHMMVPVEEGEDVLPGGGGEEEDEKEDEEDEYYVPSTLDIPLSVKTFMEDDRATDPHNEYDIENIADDYVENITRYFDTIPYCLLRDLHLQDHIRGGTGLPQETQCHQTGKRLHAGSCDHTRQEEEEQSGQRPGLGQHTEEAVGQAPGQDATVARSLHQDAGGGQLLHVSLRQGAVCHISEETRGLHPPSTRKKGKVGGQILRRVHQDDQPSLHVISLDGRKYTKKIFVEKFDKKFEGATGGEESQRSAAAAADQVVVCVPVCL